MPAPSFRHCHSEPLKHDPNVRAAEAAMAEQATERIGRFVPGEILGSGTFSIVKLGVHIGTHRKVALKILSKQKIDELGTEERVGREIRHLQLCAAHPHLMRLYDVVDTATSAVLITEYVSGGELFDHVSGRSLDPEEARGFFQQIVSAVEFMHYKRVVHRDLKLENILLDPRHENIKIVDFGLSNFVREGELMYTACGSPHYAAPEIISGKPYSGFGVDIWSVGVILYAMVCGALPFQEDNMREQFRKIKEGIYYIPSQLPAGPRNLIKGMIQVDTEKRLNTQTIQRYRWFRHNLTPYLSRSPEETETEERQTVDPRVVDDVFNLYRSIVLPNSGKVTRKLIEWTVNKDANEEIAECEKWASLQDLRCAYNLILDDKHTRDHTVELKQTKSRFSIGSWLQRARKSLT
mmetsp:Transcript_44762/g.136605  ORF Transcript_44762/g.136605 Transcript_44762/m.136605 type:complete len:408 (-) Transcript_44762:102-1325(-)